MQTFIPIPDIRLSVQCLDNARLGKQRVEAMQILQAMKNPNNGWYKHPITKMWTGYEEALKLYMNVCIDEWIGRGYKNTMTYAAIGKVIMPVWWGDMRVHDSHKSALLFKNQEWYSQFGWRQEPKLDYVWIK